jgi:protein disulfide-isomerase A1
MLKHVIAITLFLAIVNCDGYWGAPEEDEVAVLGKDNFDTFLAANPLVFVKFYAPWCGHCKSMIPAYTKLSQRMKAQENGVAIAKVDATVESEIGSKYGVQGFPTLKLFMNGEPVDYSGAREEDPMFNWLMKKTGPASSLMSTDDEANTHAGLNLSVLLLTQEGDETTLKAFMALAANYDDVPFAHATNADLFTKFEVTTKHAIVVFRNFDDGKKMMVSDEGLETGNMKKFFEGIRFPTVMDFDQKAAERIFGSQSPAMIYFTDDNDDTNLATFKELAKARQTDIFFARSTVTGGLGARLSEFLGVDKTNSPCVRLIKFEAGNLEKFVVTDLTTEGMDQALTDFLAGKLQSYYKSEPIPETNDEPVKVVVGNNFQEIVLDSDNYVMLEAYAPWCGHCKTLEPIYKELAEKVAGIKNLVIAKMEATSNEHPSLNIKGFPTINFYKPGSKTTPETYNGERTLDGMVEYLEQQMGMKVDEVLDTDL